MATPKRLDFSSTGDADSNDNSPPSSFSISRRKSRKLCVSDPSDAVAVEDTKIKKKKTKKKKKMSNQIWNEENELAVLKGLVDYRAKTGFEPIDWDAFYGFIGSSIGAKISKEQLLSKIRKLRRKFRVHLERINGRNDPGFTRSSDSEAFGFAMMLWDNNDAVVIDKAEQRKNGEEVFKEVANDDEPLNENEAAKITHNGSGGNEIREDELCVVLEIIKENGEVANDGKPHHEEVVVDKIPENGSAGKESNEDDLCFVREMIKENEELANVGKPHHEEVIVDKIPENVSDGRESRGDDTDVDEELCAVRDAFETMLSQGLSDYQKKLQLEKLMNLETGKRKELSNEWKGLCVEVAKLNVKKIRFSAKLAEAATNR